MGESVGINNVEVWGIKDEVLGAVMESLGDIRSLEGSLMGTGVNVYDHYWGRSWNGVGVCDW